MVFNLDKRNSSGYFAEKPRMKTWTGTKSISRNKPRFLRRLVDALRDGEKCVCDLQALVGDDMSTVSKHLSVLREAGVVFTEKRGTNIYYRLALCCLDTFLSCTGEIVEKRVLSQMDMLNKG